MRRELLVQFLRHVNAMPRYLKIWQGYLIPQELNRDRDRRNPTSQLASGLFSIVLGQALLCEVGFESPA